MQQSRLRIQYPTSHSSLLVDPCSLDGFQDQELDERIWRLLHLSDHPHIRFRDVEAVLVAEFRSNTITSGLPERVVSTPDWTYLCSNKIDPADSIVITRESELIAVIQSKYNQLRLTSFRPLSSRIIEAIFEMGMVWAEHAILDDRFKEWAEIVKWRLGLGALGFEFEYLSEMDLRDSSSHKNMDRALTTISLKALPASITAMQLQILYKYG